MAKLDGVISMINSRKAAKDPAPEVETRWLNPESREMEPTGSAFLDRMISTMGTEAFSAEEIREGFIALAAGMVELDERISQIVQGLDKIPSTMELGSKLDSMASGFDRMIQAMRGIKMPEVKIPPQRDVDLRPIKSAIDDLRIMIAMQAREEKEEEPEKPKEEWVFDVKRNQSGLIKSVEVKEK